MTRSPPPKYWLAEGTARLKKIQARRDKTMTMRESVVKYGFIFVVGSVVTVGSLCGLLAIFGFVFGTL
ncbi:MAG: hypothetical protein LUP95_07575 [Euryarchaeota archaeon]|nr:hypothetical protein [Euryarchaeota archaeon]